MISNKKKALIHIAKQQVGMNEEEYRGLLSSVDATSSTELTDQTFKHVMSKFETLGFKTKSQTRKRKIKGLPRSKSALMGKLEAIILDMDLTWGYVDAIANSRFKVEKAQWLEPDDLRKLVQMMVIHQKRRQKNA